MTLAAASLYVLLPRKFLPRRLTARAHRFKIPATSQAKALEPSFRNTFQLHKKSNVLHYVDANGLTVQRFQLSPKNLELKSADEVIKLHFQSIIAPADTSGSTSVATPPAAAPATHVPTTSKEAATLKSTPPPPPKAESATATSEKEAPAVAQAESQSRTTNRLGFIARS